MSATVDVPPSSGPEGPSAPSTAELLRRCDLVSLGEELASIASRQKELGDAAGCGDLMSLAVLAEGTGRLAASQTDAFARWAAHAQGDPLLGRALHELAEALAAVTAKARRAAAEAADFARVAAEDGADS